MPAPPIPSLTAPTLTAPSLTVGLPSFGDAVAHHDPAWLLDAACAAEQAGLDGVVLPEHVVMGPHPERYPYGAFPVPSDAPWLDPLTLLGFIGARTERLRLQTGILVAAARPAPVLAKQAATLDVLTGGRLDLGVGTGWQREELEACGVAYDRRGQHLTDTIGACRALWAGGPSTFRSPTVTFDELWCHPRPHTPGGPPVLFSGSLTPRTLRRIVELGDGWIPLMGTTVEQLATDAARLRQAWHAAGRADPGPRIRATLAPRPAPTTSGRPDLGATLDAAPAWVAAGATELTISLRAFVAEPDGSASWLDDLGRRWATQQATP